jgi:uncharacterized protein (DUF58 family)
MPSVLELQGALPGAHLIDPTVLARIGNLELVARSVVDGFINGLHRAPHLGASTDFAQHRQYMPGDDTRLVDWKLWARTDRYYIKEYEADTNANFSLILDSSRSMRYGANAQTNRVSKLEYGCILGACLTYFSSMQRDRIGAAAVNGEEVEFIPPSGKHLRQILMMLDRTLRDESSGPAITEAPGTEVTARKPLRPPASLYGPFKRLGEAFRRRSIIAIISDLYEEPEAIIDAITFLRGRGSDIMVFHLLDPTELDFPFADSSNFIDIETGERLPVIPDYLREQYRAIMQQHVEKLGKQLRDSRIDYGLFDTSKPLDAALFAYLSIRERMMRVR